MRLLNRFGVTADAGIFSERRAAMVERQLAGRGIRSSRVLDAMLAVPRHEFVPPTSKDAAYSDGPLPIGQGQTISQPLIVAMMTEALDPTDCDRVLEIGTGSGYQTAVLARLAKEVFTIEYRRELATTAWIRLHQLGCENVRFRQGDGGLGWPEAAPFDKILVTAAAATLPEPLVDQLAENGRLVIPMGDRECQELVSVQKCHGQIERRHLEWCRFVPLVGVHGWGRPLAG
jgi:protein-L-isoaspartate(D-aspartate) O-methyltransferase